MSPRGKREPRTGLDGNESSSDNGDKFQPETLPEYDSSGDG